MGNGRQYKRKKKSYLKSRKGREPWKTESRPLQFDFYFFYLEQDAELDLGEATAPILPHRITLPWAGDHRAWFMQTRAACMHSRSQISPSSNHATRAERGTEGMQQDTQRGTMAVPSHTD